MCDLDTLLQEFYVRHVDGSPMNTEAERLRVIQCLEGAIERRVSEVTVHQLIKGNFARIILL